MRYRIAYCKGEVNEAMVMQAPAQRVSYIGLEWDVPCAVFRFPEAWKRKALSNLTASCDWNPLPGNVRCASEAVSFLRLHQDRAVGGREGVTVCLQERVAVRAPVGR